MKKLICFIVLLFVFVNSYSQDKIIMHDTTIVSKHMVSRRLLCSIDVYNVKHIKNDSIVSDVSYVTYNYPKYYFWRKKPKF